MRSLNSRQMLFYETYLKHGFYVALKMSGGYGKQYCYRLLKDPRGREYMLSLMGNALEDAKLSLKELVKKKWDMVNDDDFSDSLRKQCLDELITYAREAGDKVEEKMRLTGGRHALEPAKEIPYEETSEESSKTG